MIYPPLQCNHVSLFTCIGKDSMCVGKKTFKSESFFFLSSGYPLVAPRLFVDNQMVTAYEGSHVVISCHDQTRKAQQWCKIGGACLNTSGIISGASVQFRSMDWGFSVTMSELTMTNTGWYLCSAGDAQMPVHITVKSSTPNWER